MAETDRIRLIYDGEVVPAVRMTARGKWLPRAQRYLAANVAMAMAFKAQMHTQGHEPFGRVPLMVCITITDKRGHICDVDNLAKAVLDAANGIVWKDDRWIDMLYVVRDVGEPCVILEVSAK